MVSNTSGKVEVSDITSTELGYLDGVSSAIQTQIDSKQATITGAATTISSDNLTASRAIVSNTSGKVEVSDITSAELGYLDGVSSAIQTQIDSKQATITGAATTISSDNLTASRAIVSNTSGKVEVSDITSTELGYLDGVSSAIQTQIDSKQATITGAATTISSDNLTASRAIVSNTSGKVEVSDITSAELGYLDGVSSAIQTQIDAKQATITGAATTISSDNLTASRAIVSNTSGKVEVSDITSAELGYLDGVSSAIQTQIDSKQATLTFGIADTNTVKINGAAAADDYARFTANGLVGRSATEVLSDIGITATTTQLNALAVQNSSTYNGKTLTVLNGALSWGYGGRRSLECY